MSPATSLGWETIATWLDGISTVVAPMRVANRRSASGGSASSSAATRYQEGSVFQAGTPITSSNIDMAIGCCPAYIGFASTGAASPAKGLKKSSPDRPQEAWESVNRCASAGVGGPCAKSAPSDSP